MLVLGKFCLSVATSGQVSSGLQDLPQALWETTFVTGTGSPVAPSPSAEEAGKNLASRRPVPPPGPAGWWRAAATTAFPLSWPPLPPTRRPFTLPLNKKRLYLRSLRPAHTFGAMNCLRAQ